MRMKIFLLSIIATAAVTIAGCMAKESYAVDELADEAVADREAFMGKEVVVHGYIAHQPRLENSSYTLSLRFSRTVHKERQLSCVVPKDKVPAETLENWNYKFVTVKGTITNIHSQNYMGLKSVQLEPCELVK